MRERRLRVGFLAAAIGGGGGMERYSRELLRALGARDDIELVVAVGRHAVDEPAELVGDSLVASVPLGGPGALGRGLRERYSVGRTLRRHGVDLVHGAKHFVPRTSLPTVLTVQDVMLLTWPKMYTAVKRLLVPRQYLASMRDATMIITPTSSTLHRMTEVVPALREKAVVVPNGVSPTLLDVVAQPLVAVADRPFALVVGDLSPRKNVGLLIDIWDEVAGATGLTLVAVGPDGWHSTETRRRLGELVDRDLAIWARHVPDAQLRWCYEHASVVLMPSIEEGFGLPIVEALTLGAPVIASTDEALVEVGQGRPQHLDPHDADGWTAAVIAAVQVPRRLPAPSAGQSDKGMTFATWADCAGGTVAVYRQALAMQRDRDVS